MPLPTSRDGVLWKTKSTRVIASSSRTTDFTYERLPDMHQTALYSLSKRALKPDFVIQYCRKSKEKYHLIDLEAKPILPAIGRIEVPTDAQATNQLGEVIRRTFEIMSTGEETSSSLHDNFSIFEK